MHDDARADIYEVAPIVATRDDRNFPSAITYIYIYMCIYVTEALSPCRVDDLYRFIHAWVPTLYGELDENYWRERGYILSDTDTDLSPELSPHEAGTDTTEEGKARSHDGDEITELTRESWEVSVVCFICIKKKNIYIRTFIYTFIYEMCPSPLEQWELVGSAKVFVDEIY